MPGMAINVFVSRRRLSVSLADVRAAVAEAARQSVRDQLIQHAGKRLVLLERKSEEAWGTPKKSQDGQAADPTRPTATPAEAPFNYVEPADVAKYIPVGDGGMSGIERTAAFVACQTDVRPAKRQKVENARAAFQHLARTAGEGQWDAACEADRC